MALERLAPFLLVAATGLVGCSAGSPGSTGDAATTVDAPTAADARMDTGHVVDTGSCGTAMDPAGCACQPSVDTERACYVISGSVCSAGTTHCTGTGELGMWGPCTGLVAGQCGDAGTDAAVPTDARSTTDATPAVDAPTDATVHTALPCALPWGGSIPSGGSVTAYSTSTPTAACTAVAQTRTCADGVLSGSFTHASCADGCPSAGLTSGQSITGYAAPNAASYAACGTRGTTTCTNGSVSGSGGPYPTCTFTNDQVCPGVNPAYGWFQAHNRCGSAVGQSAWNTQAAMNGNAAAFAGFTMVWNHDCMPYADDTACNNALLCNGATYTPNTNLCTLH